MPYIDEQRHKAQQHEPRSPRIEHCGDCKGPLVVSTLQIMETESEMERDRRNGTRKFVEKSRCL